jgi:hypothetical protein
MSIEIRSVAEVEPLVARVRAAADVTAQRLRDLTGDANDGLTVLRRLKFSKFARHPVEDRDRTGQPDVDLFGLTPSATVPLRTGPRSRGFRLICRHRGRYRHHELWCRTLLLPRASQQCIRRATENSRRIWRNSHATARRREPDTFSLRHPISGMSAKFSWKSCPELKCGESMSDTLMLILSELFCRILSAIFGTGS